MDRIHLSAPDIREPERRRILEAIDSGWAAPAGPAIDEFEGALSSLTGGRPTVALSSGTAAVHLALVALGVGPGDDVYVSTMTFAGSVNPIVYQGASPVFIDSEAESWNMCPDLLDEALATAAAVGRRPRAVIVVDLYGQCANYERILRACRHYEVPVIEDAAEALGASRGGRPAGDFGEYSILSFNGNKLITTSGGGALVCPTSEAADRVRFLSTQAREAVLHYEHREIGYNYRLSNLLAAFGVGQLENLTDRIVRRREIFRRYERLVADSVGISMMPVLNGNSPNFWLSCVQITSAAQLTSRDLIRHLAERGIESRPLWKPMHLQPIHAERDSWLSGVSETIFADGICLPSGSGMQNAEIERVMSAIREAL